MACLTTVAAQATSGQPQTRALRAVCALTPTLELSWRAHPPQSCWRIVRGCALVLHSETPARCVQVELREWSLMLMWIVWASALGTPLAPPALGPRLDPPRRLTRGVIWMSQGPLWALSSHSLFFCAFSQRLLFSGRGQTCWGALMEPRSLRLLSTSNSLAYLSASWKPCLSSPSKVPLWRPRGLPVQPVPQLCSQLVPRRLMTRQPKRVSRVLFAWWIWKSGKASCSCLATTCTTQSASRSGFSRVTSAPRAGSTCMGRCHHHALHQRLPSTVPQVHRASACHPRFVRIRSRLWNSGGWFRAVVAVMHRHSGRWQCLVPGRGLLEGQEGEPGLIGWGQDACRATLAHLPVNSRLSALQMWLFFIFRPCSL